MRIQFPTIALGAALSLALAAAAAEAQGPGRRRNEIPADVEVLRDLEFGTGGGRPLLLDLYRLKSRAPQPAPAVVVIHGGGWAKGDKATVFGAIALAQRGFIAVSVNYRLSGEAPFPAAVEDCKCAVRWLRAHAEEYAIDPDHIGAWGSSAGGQIALMVAYSEAGKFEGTGGWKDQSSRVQAVCSWFGPTDMRIVDRPPYAYLGGSLRDAPKQYELASPVVHVSADDPPTQLAYGDQDPVVPFEHAESLAARLKEAGVEFELLVVENAGHGFKPMGSASPSLGLREVEDRSAEYFERKLKPAAK